MIDWLIINKGLISLFISLIALALSVYNASKQRIIYEYLVPNKPVIINQLFYKTPNKNYRLNSTKMVKCSIDIINRSTFDIGFFNLIAYDPNTKVEKRVITSENIVDHETGKFLYTLTSGPEKYLAYVPGDTHGILKSHSFTRFDFFVEILDSTEMIIIELQIPKRKYFST